MKLGASVWLGLCLVLGTAAVARESSSSFRPEFVIREVFEKAQTPEQLVFLSAFFGAKSEFLTNLQDELAQAPPRTWPRLAIENHEIVVNKRATGIWIDPQYPLRLAYRGNTWNYDGAQSPEKNYLSLRKFLNSSATAQRGYPWMNEARAEWTNRDLSGAAGIAIGIAVVAGGVTAMALLATSGAVLIPMVAAVGLVAAGHVGLGVGEHVYDYRTIHKAMKNIAASSEIEVKCDEKNSKITMKGADGNITVLDFVHDKTGNSIRYSDGIAGHPLSIADQEMAQYPYDRMMVCRDKRAAAAVATDLRSAMAELKKTLSDKNTTTVPSSSVNSTK